MPNPFEQQPADMWQVDWDNLYTEGETGAKMVLVVSIEPGETPDKLQMRPKYAAVSKVGHLPDHPINVLARQLAMKLIVGLTSSSDFWADPAATALNPERSMEEPKE